MATMSNLDTGQKKAFEERLNRISKGGPNTLGKVYVGPVSDEVLFNKGKGGSTSAEHARRRMPNLWYPVSLIGGGVVGMIAVVLARYARFQLNGGGLTGENADMLLMVDAALAMLFGLVLRSIFRFSAKETIIAMMFGICAILTLMHDFVHTYPDFWAGIFSPDWVSEVVTSTEPQSVLFRGASFTL